MIFTLASDWNVAQTPTVVQTRFFPSPSGTTMGGVQIALSTSQVWVVPSGAQSRIDFVRLNGWWLSFVEPEHCNVMSTVPLIRNVEMANPAVALGRFCSHVQETVDTVHVALVTVPLHSIVAQIWGWMVSASKQ
ncbi:MAG: hypothetical protein M0Z66_08760 [Thermaerobacter sp.]|nr:hypothetical protein [Thermaerobacter sp.]